METHPPESPPEGPAEDPAGDPPGGPTDDPTGDPPGDPTGDAPGDTPGDTPGGPPGDTPSLGKDHSQNFVPNLYSGELTFEEAVSLFAGQTFAGLPELDLPVPGEALDYQPAPETDMDKLLRELGDEAGASPAEIQYWEETDSVAPDPADETLELIRGIEVTIATVDDTTVATRDRVATMADSVRSIAESVIRLERAAEKAASDLADLRSAVAGMSSAISLLLAAEVRR